MATDFAEALRAEIAALEAELGVDLRYRRLSELRRVLSLYPNPTPQGREVDSVNVESPGRFAFTTPGSVIAAAGGKITVRRRTSPERLRALEEARKFLDGRGDPTPIRDIYDHLIGLGVTISGEVPLNNLSAMLSNSDDFLSHGRIGWTLRGADDTIPEKLFGEIAETIAADLESERLRHIYAASVRHGEDIPRDVDSALLLAMRESIRRDLTESEKRELRAAFKAHVEGSLTPAERISLSGLE